VTRVARHRLCVEGKPRRDRACGCRFSVLFEDRDIAAAFCNCYDIALLEGCAGNVELASVDSEMAVADELACLAAAYAETETIDHVVKAAFEKLEEVVAGLARSCLSAYLVDVAELCLVQAVEAAELLLLAETDAVFA
jgi:hypothetical protein